jgi:hypothetical protein
MRADARAHVIVCCRRFSRPAAAHPASDPFGCDKGCPVTKRGIKGRARAFLASARKVIT